MGRAKQLGPFLKIVLCIFMPVPLILWPVLSIVGSIVGGALYGFLSPVFATFDAVGEGKTEELYHCFVVCIYTMSWWFIIFLFSFFSLCKRISLFLYLQDGTWDTVKKSCTFVRDFGDCCYHSYSSYMDDLQWQQPPDRKHYEIRFSSSFLFSLSLRTQKLLSLCSSSSHLLIWVNKAIPYNN